MKYLYPDPQPERVDDAIGFIRLNPDLHDQETWGRRTSCGTTMCLAGHIVVQAGYQLVFQPYFERQDVYYASDCVDSAGNTHDIETLAAKLAGLDAEEANKLFYCYGGIEELAHRWKDIQNNRA